MPPSRRSNDASDTTRRARNADASEKAEQSVRHESGCLKDHENTSEAVSHKFNDEAGRNM